MSILSVKKIGVYVCALLLIPASLSFDSCTGRRGAAKQMNAEDSVRVASDRAYLNRLKGLQAVREELTGPVDAGDPAVKAGDKFKTNLLDDSSNVVTGSFEKLKAKMERAQKDSTTVYGALLTRFRLLNSQHKYLTATYSDEAHLLRYTEEVTLDDKHEEDRDFYFNSGELVYFREKHTFTKDDQDMMTDDAYFLKNGKVVYSYRDEGSALESKDRINLMSTKRYLLHGDLTSHVAREFEHFKHDYDILLSQPLEPLIYPGTGQNQ